MLHQFLSRSEAYPFPIPVRTAYACTAWRLTPQAAVLHSMHRAPIPEEDPIPGDEPEPDADPVPHADPIIREPELPSSIPMSVAGGRGTTDDSHRRGIR